MFDIFDPSARIIGGIMFKEYHDAADEIAKAISDLLYQRYDSFRIIHHGDMDHDHTPAIAIGVTPTEWYKERVVQIRVQLEMEGVYPCHVLVWEKGFGFRR